MWKVCYYKIIIGLLDVYVCGCFIFDFLWVVVYGIDCLMEDKVNDFVYIGDGELIDDVICFCEEV